MIFDCLRHLKCVLLNLRCAGLKGYQGLDKRHPQSCISVKKRRKQNVPLGTGSQSLISPFNSGSGTH